MALSDWSSDGKTAEARMGGDRCAIEDILWVAAGYGLLAPLLRELLMATRASRVGEVVGVALKFTVRCLSLVCGADDGRLEMDDSQRFLTAEVFTKVKGLCDSYWECKLNAVSRNSVCGPNPKWWPRVCGSRTWYVLWRLFILEGVLRRELATKSAMSYCSNSWWDGGGGERFKKSVKTFLPK
ncbi:hypothetical protein J6590_084239 [Homalodisca vitripennis]|nr:hypothetical protein J6590_084239 [Homalodisca vitripennis]